MNQAATKSIGARMLAAPGWLLFSPGGWVVLGLVPIALWGLAHLLGWRSYTGAFSGTMPAPGARGETLALLGLLYAALYFWAVLVAPVFCIAGLMRVVVAGLTPRRV